MAPTVAVVAGRSSFALVAAWLLLAAGAGAEAAEAPQPELAEHVARGLGAEGEAYRAAVAAGLPLAEEQLAPILATVPRNPDRTFDPPAVRYALHHYFARRYGWQLLGLAPAGGAWNDSSVAEVAAFHRLPEPARAALSRELAKGGLTDRGAVTLAVTLEYLLRGEAMERLTITYAKLGLSTTSPLSQALAQQAAEAYMTSFMLSVSPEVVASNTREKLLELHRDMPETYPAWPGIVKFVHERLAANGSVGGRYSFEQVAAAIGAIGQGFGQWQRDNVCTGLKKNLIEIEEQGTGRVLLSEFYKAGLNGHWEFQESVEYLRQLGALDESSPAAPRVIIANWVDGRSNCIGSSGSHDICCVSECEALLSSLETRLASPAASPRAVEAAVAQLTSPTMGARRDLDPVLRQRLQAIAAAHGGSVPIYGRLFAQWLHHAFPHECPYPHLAGATKPTNVFEFEGASAAALADEAVMKSAAARRERRDAPRHSVPWSTEEELFSEPIGQRSRPMGVIVVHAAATLVAFGLVLFGLARSTLRRLVGGPALLGKPLAASAAAARRAAAEAAKSVDVGLAV